MMNRITYILLIILCAGFFSPDMNAQRKRKSAEVNIRSVVLDSHGKPLQGVLVTGNEGKDRTYTAADGTFNIRIQDNTALLFEKTGYNTVVLDVKDRKFDKTVIMGQAPLYSGEDDTFKLPQGVQVTRRSFNGPVSSVSGEDLASYPDLVINNGLSGRLSGLTTVQTAGEFGRNLPEFYIRGMSTLGNSQAVVIVDGIERSMLGLLPEEIESVSVLKDATAKILYGSRAANGVIMITTKRGEAYKRSIEVSAEYGVSMPLSLPEYLNAGDYAILYNEARVNDGFSTYYSQSDIDGYDASQGMNDLRYPDLDYHDYFLKSAGQYRKVTARFLGGNEGAMYSVVAGYTGGTGLESAGRTSATDRLSIRGNLDVRITDALSASLDVAARVELDNGNDMTGSDFFTALSSYRPNEFPIFLQGKEIDTDMYGTEVFGGSLVHPENLYMKMTRGGYRSERYFTGQTNLGFDLDADKFIEGLKAKVYVTLDNYAFLRKGQSLSSLTYAPLWYVDADGREILDLMVLNERAYQGDVDIKEKEIRFNLGYYGGLSYQRAFGRHDLDAGLSYMYFRNGKSGDEQDIKNSNLVLRVAYDYDGRYYADITGAMMGSGRFAKGHRQMFSPAAGIGWVISEENWFNRNFIDYFKLRATFGILGYDATTPFYLYEQRWSNRGDIGFGNPNDEANIGTVGAGYAANPDLKWEKSREFNVGADLLMADGRLSFSADYFNYYRYDIIQQVLSGWQTTAGHLIPYENWGAVSSHGFEAEVVWKENRQDLSYSVGVQASWSKSTIGRTVEIPYYGRDSYRSVTGAPADYILGYRSLGLFGADFARSEYPIQTLGSYGPGDIRYADLNNDGIIDDLDRTVIGNSLPRAVLSLDISLQYKGFGLYILGTAHAGVDRILGNSYYWNCSTGKYSSLASDRWHKNNNPGGTYPRLTTTAGTNNFTDSDFWLADAGFFRLKNVELSYTITSRNPNAVLNNLKIYMRGANLLTISAVRDSDPEDIDAGVTAYPFFRTLTGGLKLTF